jgi:hypothetical protein
MDRIVMPYAEGPRTVDRIGPRMIDVVVELVPRHHV